MNEINTIEALYDALCLNGISSVDEIEDRFIRIADALFNVFVIQKGNKQYRFAEIEFYHSLTDEGKLITYQRITDACHFFFHKSGVDLTFASDANSYGGILIRALQSGDQFFNGPYIVVDELFDHFDAIHTPNDFPHLVVSALEPKIKPVAHKRWHIDSSKDYRFTLPRNLWNGKKYPAYPWDSRGQLK